jgi:hypothetical protein
MDQRIERLRAIAAANSIPLGKLLGDDGDPRSTPRPGDWLVDLDVLDGALAGKVFDQDENLAVPIPARFKIVDSTEYAAVRRQAKESARRAKRR